MQLLPIRAGQGPEWWRWGQDSGGQDSPRCRTSFSGDNAPNVTMSSPLPHSDVYRSASQILPKRRCPCPARPGRGLNWGFRGTPISTPGDFRGNQDPEMNELSGLGILDGSGVGRAGTESARSSQQGPEVEGNRSEKRGGARPEGAEQGGGGRGDYWRWVGPRRHFVEWRGCTGLAAALTIFCFLRRHLSYRLSRRHHHHHSRLLSPRRTVTSSHCTAHPDGAAALPSLVRPLAPPQDMRPLRSLSGQIWVSQALIGCHASSLRGQVRLREQNSAWYLEAVRRRNAEEGGGRAPEASWNL